MEKKEKLINIAPRPNWGTWEKELDEMLGTYFQHEMWDAEGGFEEKYKEWKSKLKLEEIVFLYYSYWSVPTTKEFKVFKELFEFHKKVSKMKIREE